MRIADMHWGQVEAYLAGDDRCVLPLGSTEQHAFLSLCTDNILAERVALDAAGPLGIPVFPPLNYGITPYFRAFPGTVNLRVDTYLRIIGDVLDSLYAHGFRRILIVNGHGGNRPAEMLCTEWLGDHPGARVRFHNWWAAPKTWAEVTAIDPVASHASWMENFPWTRLEGVTQPPGQKPEIASDLLATLSPSEARALLGDGSFAGLYQRPDDDMLRIWRVAVDETRALLTEGW